MAEGRTIYYTVAHYTKGEEMYTFERFRTRALAVKRYRELAADPIVGCSVWRNTDAGAMISTSLATMPA